MERKITLRYLWKCLGPERNSLAAWLKSNSIDTEGSVQFSKIAISVEKVGEFLRSHPPVNDDVQSLENIMVSKSDIVRGCNISYLAIEEWIKEGLRVSDKGKDFKRSELLAFLENRADFLEIWRRSEETFYLTLVQVSRLCGVSTGIINYWIKSCGLLLTTFPPTKFISHKSLIEFLEERRTQLHTLLTKGEVDQYGVIVSKAVRVTKKVERDDDLAGRLIFPSWVLATADTMRIRDISLSNQHICELIGKTGPCIINWFRKVGEPLICKTHDRFLSPYLRVLRKMRKQVPDSIARMSPGIVFYGDFQKLKGKVLTESQANDVVLEGSPSEILFHFAESYEQAWMMIGSYRPCFVVIGRNVSDTDLLAFMKNVKELQPSIRLLVERREEMEIFRDSPADFTFYLTDGSWNFIKA